jgi:hypothetical protein
MAVYWSKKRTMRVGLLHRLLKVMLELQKGAVPFAMKVKSPNQKNPNN